MLSTCVIGLAEELDAQVVAIDAAVDSLLDREVETLTAGQHLALLRRLEHAARRLSAAGTAALVALSQYATAEEVADTVPMAVASALRISPVEARRRIHEAEDLTPRRAMTGPALPARLEHTAPRHREGRIGVDHIAVIGALLH